MRHGRNTKDPPRWRSFHGPFFRFRGSTHSLAHSLQHAQSPRHAWLDGLLLLVKGFRPFSGSIPELDRPSFAPAHRSLWRAVGGGDVTLGEAQCDRFAQGEGGRARAMLEDGAMTHGLHSPYLWFSITQNTPSLNPIEGCFGLSTPHARLHVDTTLPGYPKQFLVDL